MATINADGRQLASDMKEILAAQEASEAAGIASLEQQDQELYQLRHELEVMNNKLEIQRVNVELSENENEQMRILINSEGGELKRVAAEMQEERRQKDLLASELRQALQEIVLMKEGYSPQANELRQALQEIVLMKEGFRPEAREDPRSELLVHEAVASASSSSRSGGKKRILLISDPYDVFED